MMTLLFILSGVSILAGLYLKIFTDSVPDNTLGAGFWLNGFYGGVLKPGFVWFKLPGARIITHSTKPREDKKVCLEFRAEPKKGFIVVIKGTLIFGIDHQMSNLDNFERFHRNEGSLESSTSSHIRVWLDDRIRQEEDPSENGTLSQIEREAIVEIKRYAREEFSAIVITAEFKMDVEEEIRRAIEEEKKQTKLNAAENLRQTQFNAMVDALMLGAGGSGLTRKEAATIILARMDKKANISDQTFNVKGLEGLSDAARIIVAALNKKENNK